MRRITSIALLSLVLTATVARDRDRDFVRFFRQLFRHFIGSTTSDDLVPPKP